MSCLHISLWENHKISITKQILRNQWKEVEISWCGIMIGKIRKSFIHLFSLNPHFLWFYWILTFDMFLFGSFQRLLSAASLQNWHRTRIGSAVIRLRRHAIPSLPTAQRPMSWLPVTMVYNVCVHVALCQEFISLKAPKELQQFWCFLSLLYIKSYTIPFEDLRHRLSAERWCRIEAMSHPWLKKLGRFSSRMSIGCLRNVSRFRVRA